MIPGLNFEGQVSKTMDLVSEALQSAGLNMSDIVNVTIYMRDLKDFAAMNTVYRTYFPSGDFPARATIAVKDILGNSDIEISVVAKDK